MAERDRDRLTDEHKGLFNQINKELEDHEERIDDIESWRDVKRGERNVWLAFWAFVAALLIAGAVYWLNT